MINRVVLVGRLTKDADLRYTSSGTAVASFTVAVNRQYTNQQGEREADFINCVAWRKTGETLANFTRKGSLIGVEGRIQSRNYDNQQGQKVFVTEVIIDTFSLLESKQINEQRQNKINSSAEVNQATNKQSSPHPQNSSSNYQSSHDQFDNAHPINISDDDLPF